MNNNLLSVIIPVYNTEKYLTRCLNSVINQSYKNLELIVINDGSTDHSQDLINDFSIRYNNIQCIQLQENKGLGNARNLGLNKARGKYVSFIDSDDWIDSNFYRVLINNIQKYDLDIAIGGIINEFDDRNVYTYRYQYPFDNQISNDFALELLAKSNNQDIYITPIVNNKVYNLEIIKKNNLNFLVNSYNEDDIFSFLLFNIVKRVGIVKDVFYHYYQRDSSISGQFTHKHVDDIVAAYKYLIDIKKFDKFDDKLVSYFERNMSFIFELLFSSRMPVADIKKSLIYIWHKVAEIYTLDEFINRIEIRKIKQFLGINS